MGNIEIRDDQQSQTFTQSDAFHYPKYHQSDRKSKDKRPNIFDDRKSQQRLSKSKINRHERRHSEIDPPQNKSQNKLSSSQIYYSPIRLSHNKASKSPIQRRFQPQNNQIQIRHNYEQKNFSPIKNYAPFTGLCHQQNQIRTKSKLQLIGAKNEIKQRNDEGYMMHSQPDNLNLKQEKENYLSKSTLVGTSQRKGRIVPNSGRKGHYHHAYRTNFCDNEEDLDFSKFSVSQSQNTQIIKKVRNFNDFLNSIKQKLKQQSYQTLQRNSSIRSNLNMEHIYPKGRQVLAESMLQTRNTPECIQYDQTFEKLNAKRKIEVELKLENEKLELEKYKQLVERELSKNHSIQSISLNTKKSGEKILTIEYENLPKVTPSNSASLKSLNSQKSNQDLKLLQGDHFKKPNQRDINKANFDSTIKKNVTQKYVNADAIKIFEDTEAQNISHSFKAAQKQNEKVDHQIVQLRRKYNFMMSKLLGLDQMITQLENSRGINRQKSKDQRVSPAQDPREEKVDRLFHKLEQIQTECLQSERSARQLIEKLQDSDDDSPKNSLTKQP